MALPTVIVPVFNAYEHLHRCLRSLASASPDARVVLVDDASTDARVLPALQEWAAAHPGRTLVRHPANRGFVHTANTGLQRAAGDAVLLNSDTEVTEGWLEALGRCLASDAGIATATPWTNNGEIASLPEFCRPNPPPAAPAQVARVIRACGPPSYPGIPTAVGFCMAISRVAIDRLGLFDAATFGRGYGEENDFSLRAAAAGMRNVLCDDAYVIHHGGASFGPLGLKPDQASMDRLLSLHPGYLQRIGAFIDADPLAERRGALVEALDRAGVRIR